MDDLLDLYKNIKKRRLELKLSQEELASRVGYKDRTSIAKIETGKIDLPQSKIIDFADALGVTPSYLMGLDESMPIGKALHNERIEQGLSIDDISHEIGISSKKLRNIEAGFIQPSEIELKALSEYYGYSTVDFLSEYELFDEDIPAEFEGDLGKYLSFQKAVANDALHDIVDDSLENDMLRKYNTLDDYGKETVDIALERELKRCQAMDIKLNAAHELPNATEDGKARDNEKINKLLRDKK